MSTTYPSASPATPTSAADDRTASRQPYVDTTLITGSAGGWTRRVLEPVVLLLAAAADVAAFYDVLSSSLDTPTHLLYLLVAGFTVVALLLAHGCGESYRDLSQGAPQSRRAVFLVCLVGWAGLGVAAFVSRLLLADEQSAGGFDAGGQSTEGASNVVMAILFAALYLGTGSAAAVVAYWNHNSLRRAYAASRKQLDRAGKAAARQAGRHESVLAVHRQRYNEWWRTEAAHAAARQARLALAAELKELARHRMAASAQDPAATDGLFTTDRHPPAAPSPYRERTAPDGSSASSDTDATGRAGPPAAPPPTPRRNTAPVAGPVLNNTPHEQRS
ncbi:hypothetical protein [Micromonospora echinofusca]|uniref:hypothetical protein n=1 Tax=Micromonospora echinofusca TaxID=47858 RepID=UPI0033E41460